MYVVINAGQKKTAGYKFCPREQGAKSKNKQKKKDESSKEHIPHALAAHITSALSCNLDICCRRTLPSRARPVVSRKHMHMDSAVNGHSRWAWL